MFTKTLLTSATLVVFASFLGSCTPAQNPSGETNPMSQESEPEQASDVQAANPALNLDATGRALQGYDPVAYFEADRPTPGEATWSTAWQGANWYFSSAENQEKFEEDPEKYAPKNGGYCTFGVVLSKKFDGDPKVWFIRNEKLYVFLNEEVKQKFLQDEPGNFERVQKNWPPIKDKLPEEL